MNEFELFAWSPAFDLPSADPICVTIITYLNMSGAKWTLNECSNARISPNGQLPVLRAGLNVVGINNIIQALKHQGFDLDSLSDPSQVIESNAFSCLIEETLFDVLLCVWWTSNQQGIPSPLRERAKQTQLLYNGKDIYSIARDAYQALSDKLGDNQYFFGNSQPTTLDAIAVSHLSFHAYPSMADPKLFSMLAFEFPNLIQYCSRLNDSYLKTVKSPFSHRPISAIITSFIVDPLQFLNGSDTSISDSDKFKKERNVKRFWKNLSVVGSVAFFVSFVTLNNCIRAK